MADAHRESLEQYKSVIAWILPRSFLNGHGLLKPPTGGSETIRVVPPSVTSRSLLGWLAGERPSDVGGASYSGNLMVRLLRRRLQGAKDEVPPEEHEILSRWCDKTLQLAEPDTIDLTHQKRPGSLAHEAFHDIQGYLLDYHPQIYGELEKALLGERASIEAWYADPATARWRTATDYTLQHVFPGNWAESPYKWVAGTIIRELKDCQETPISENSKQLACEVQMDLGVAEGIPVLLAAATEGCGSATRILSRIFGSAGLNADFYNSFPRQAVSVRGWIIACVQRLCGDAL